MIPPTIAAVFDDFCAAPVDEPSELPAVVPEDDANPDAVMVIVTVLAEVTTAGVAVVVTVVILGVSTGITMNRSRKSSASAPVLVIVNVCSAAGRTGESKKTWLYLAVSPGSPSKLVAVPVSIAYEEVGFLVKLPAIVPYTVILVPNKSSILIRTGESLGVAVETYHKKSPLQSLPQ